MKIVKDFLAGVLTAFVNSSLCLLRNRKPTNFTREEIRFFNYGFGMCQEDIAVVRWVNILQIHHGIYVDTGGFDPVFLSNTLFLQKRGWRGVNIDMNPERIAKFNLARPNDFNIAAAISDCERDTSMLSYPGRGTDRLACAAGDSGRSLSGEAAISTTPVRTQTLNEVLSKCPFDIPRIDYLNVDIEGHDLEALKGLDFKKYRPAIITVEATTEENMKGLLDYLEPLGYRMEEKLFDTLLLVDKRLPADRSKLYG